MNEISSKHGAADLAPPIPASSGEGPRTLVETRMRLYIQSSFVSFAGTLAELARNMEYLDRYLGNGSETLHIPREKVEEKKTELEAYVVETREELSTKMMDFLDGLVDRLPTNKKAKARVYLRAQRKRLDIASPAILDNVRAIVTHVLAM